MQKILPTTSRVKGDFYFIQITQITTCYLCETSRSSCGWWAACCDRGRSRRSLRYTSCDRLHNALVQVTNSWNISSTRWIRVDYMYLPRHVLIQSGSKKSWKHPKIHWWIKMGQLKLDPVSQKHNGKKATNLEYTDRPVWLVELVHIGHFLLLQGFMQRLTQFHYGRPHSISSM